MTIEVENIDVGYDGIEMLRNVSLTVARGEVLGVLGRNGIGKSTLILALSDLLPMSRGRRNGCYELARACPRPRWLDDDRAGPRHVSENDGARQSSVGSLASSMQ